MKLLYTCMVYLGGWLTVPISWFSPKIREWRQGRKVFPSPKPDCDRPVWIHCASLGEFEQARPVLEAIREEFQWPILLSFFSPSGYRIRKDYPGADQVIYLPLDTPANARCFISTFRPRLAIMVKYDLWFNHLQACLNENIPLVLISAHFTSGHWLFKRWARPFRQILMAFNRIFVQDESSMRILIEHGFSRVIQAGDTRIDRILQLPDESRALPVLEEFTGPHPVLVAGSTWPKDEGLLLEVMPAWLDQGWKLILVPHDIHPNHIQDLETQWSAHAMQTMSHFNHGQPAQVLLVDQIGLLAYLYRYATLVYIGGGFGAGIHNTLEPMAYGKPVFFGPRYHQFPEASFLIESGSGQVIHQPSDLEHAMHYFKDTPQRAHCREQIAFYLASSQGATEKILAYLRREFPRME